MPYQQRLNPALSAFTSEQLSTYTVLKRLKEYIGDTSLSNLGNVCLNEICRDHATQLSKDQLTMHGSQGYRSCRSTHGVSTGTFYFEAIPHLPPDISKEEIDSISELQYRPQWRIGIASADFETGWAVGYDAYGFSLRSIDGSLCHLRERHTANTRLARRVRNPGETFEEIIADEDARENTLFAGALPEKSKIYTYVEFLPQKTDTSTANSRSFFYEAEDVIGVLIYLPNDPELPELPNEVEIGIDRTQEKHSSKVGSKGVAINQGTKTSPPQETSLWTSIDDSGVVSRKKATESQKEDLRPLRKGSFATFFVNGKAHCIVYNLPHDRYYAAGSSFLYGSIEFNFGPRNAVNNTFPADWRCLPFCLLPADESREALAKTFRYYESAERWYTFKTEIKPQNGDSSTLIFPTIKPLTSLYISRAADEYKEVLDVFARNQMTLTIWNAIARAYGDTVYGPIRKRSLREQHIKK